MRIAALALVLFMLAACSIMPKAPVVEVNSPLVPAPKMKTKSIALGKMVIKLPRNTVYGSVHWDLFCQYKSADLRWIPGSVSLNDMLMTTVLLDELADAGYQAVNDPTAIFQEVHQGADLTLAAEIMDMEQRVCTPFQDFARPKDVRGWARMTVRWQIRSNLHRKVVLDLTTEGLYEQQDAVTGGEIMVLQEALAAAVRNLMADKRFFALATGELDETHMAQAEAERLEWDSISLPKIKPLEGPLADNTIRILPAVVVITDAMGHGSGFFVSDDGYILTNAHVVQTSRFVNVRLLSGREIMGEVLRKDDVRDVALVKVGETGMPFLPILRRKEQPVGSEIYAVGAPLETKLSHTVTKGVLSAYRVYHDGLKYIQSDVNIQGGNSGGPLVDQSGNVIGISVLGRVDPATRVSLGLNFFIPISEAMTAMGLK